MPTRTLRAGDAPSTQPAKQLTILSISGDNGTLAPLELVGRDAHWQIVVTGSFASGEERDLTRGVRYAARPAGVVQVSDSGMLTPVGDGEASVEATDADGRAASIAVRVKYFNNPQPINFANQIVPIFTKAGCNGGGCHGKLSGQNGFRLSLLGFEPTEDYEHLVRESRGRRLSPAAPEHSLLLLKATGMLPHGGGKRIDASSDDYKLLVRWITQGMPVGGANDPSVASIEVFPNHRTEPLGGEQQLSVVARYTDGTVQDVTRSAVYETGEREMASVDSGGRVTFYQQPGTVSVMVRYQGRIAVFQATLPLGASVGDLPAPRNFIDALAFKHLRITGMPPSAECDDATFVRRVTIDIAGRLPTVAEATELVRSNDPAKRDKLIDRLLDSGDYADYFANKWCALLRNHRTAANYQRGNYLFHDWIRDSLYANKPFDQFVREILTASGTVTDSPPTEWYRQVTAPTDEVEDVAQLFLGTRIQCAKCHHHPYEKWSQKDYYSLAAFFSQVARRPAESGELAVYVRRAAPGVVNAKTGQVVKPCGLGDTAPSNPSPDDDARADLADWIVSPDNRFFARALVNRYWKHFFGRALVEPEDDLRDTNPATNPELLDALAKHFVQSRFELKDLIRTICRSRTYQLSAVPNAYNATDKQNYSRYYPKRLTAEVLLDSVNALAGSKGGFGGLPAGTRAVQLPDNSFNVNSYFLTVFGRPESSSACECERSQDASLAQSLHLLNSQDVLSELSAADARPAALAADAARDDDQKIRELYLMAYSREPSADEAAFARRYLTRRKSDTAGAFRPVNKREAYEDVIWALINTKEFLFNH
ncbi:MAG TPA: DUF1549 and DUF1553 domain-containing protein [Tepidisphaeraceae bacterium]